MSIFKTARLRAILVLSCLGLPPPAVTLAATEAPWDNSPAPFVFHSTVVQVTENQRVTRGLQLQGVSGVRVAPDRTLRLQGPILGHPANPLMPIPFWKLGTGHLELAGASTTIGQIVLAEGSLGLAHDHALGAPLNTLDMTAGTRLDLRAGVHVGHALQIRSAATARTLPVHWGLPPLTGLSGAAVWRVPAGTATLAGGIQSEAPILKDGAGTLRLTGTGYSASGDPLVLAQGGLQVDYAWTGPVISHPDTILSGVGVVDQAQVAGRLHPGTPGQTGALVISNRLVLQPSAQTRIRIDASGQADQIRSFGTARLGGALRVEPAPGGWTPAQRWIIAQADGGLDYGPDVGPDPAPGDGRYTQVSSALRYFDPVLDYGPTTVTLGLRYNAQGLNTADAAWRGAVLDDSRFLRDAALAHTRSGRAWGQTWAANTQRSGTQGLPGDDRDTTGVQLGISHRAGAGAIAAFAGLQHSHQRTAQATAGGAYQVRDQAWHLGLGAGVHHRGWHLTLGAAHTWHRADLSRQADPGEASLRSRPVAHLSQAWAQIQPDAALPLGAWNVRPYAQAVWLRLRRPAVDETGGLAAVTMSAQTDQRWLGQLGVQISRLWPTPLGAAEMTLDLGVRRLWGGTTLHGTQAYQADPARTWQAGGLLLPRDVLRVDLGVQAPVSRHARVVLAYTGQHGGGQMQHGVWLGVQGVFR